MSISKNTAWNLFGSALPMAIGLLAVPFILKHLGVELLGVLTLVWAIIGYFSIFDFGLGRALTQSVAKLRSLGKYAESSRAIYSGLVLVIVLGFAGSLLLLVGLYFFGVDWLSVSDKFTDDVKKSLMVAALAIPFTTVTSGLKGVLEGVQRFAVVNKLKLVLGFANFLTPVLAIVVFGSELFPIVCLLVAARGLVAFLHFYAIRDLFDTRLIKRGFRFDAESKALLSFGSWMSLSNILSPLMVVSDRFVISALMGASVVAYYTVPSEFLVRLLIVPAALTSAVFPVFSDALATNPKKAKSVYVKSILMVFAVMSCVGLMIVFGAEQALAIWVGQDFSINSGAVVQILAIGIIFNSVAQVPHSLIQANGNAKVTSLFHLLEFALYLPLIILCIKYFGIEGAAVAWVLRAALDFVLLHAYVIFNVFSKMDTVSV